MTTPFQFVYEFNQERVDGKPEMKDLLGGKGAGLAGMCSIGLPVPPGFTISTRACTLFHQNQKAFRQRVWPEVLEALHRLEEVTGKQFGKTPCPLLLSVRSGAKFSMPGMMDTVLNIGLNDRIVDDLLEQNEAADLVYDCYRRLLQRFGNVVMDVPRRAFEKILARRRKEKEVRYDIELEADELGRICEEFKELIRDQSGPFPQDPVEQLRPSVEAVFQSWNNPRAVTYRQLNDISEDLGTAVNVQMMVFGNRGADSASGVGFTRNPSTGEPGMYGEFLPRSQGEEVVAGTRTPLGLEEMMQTFPEAHHKLQEYAARLETTYREMQNFEFAIETGKLYLLQTRDGKRTGVAAVRIARDMHQEGLISREEAVMR
ncbi:MAG: PEP/pyruvate-binding domain-containing protein, partial [Acidobacteriota bacterium]